MSLVFITGADGFVGKYLQNLFKEKNIIFKAGVRNSKSPNEVSYGNLSEVIHWEKHLIGVETVVHLAARVHIMNETTANPLDEFRKVNTQATINLAMTAKKMGIKRFIFISSIKVNGEQTFETPFLSSDTPHPEDNYAQSKYEAEVELMKLHEPGRFEVVIIRPTLIYGPGVRANFANLIRMVQLRIPLPFGCVQNKRSLLSVYNLCDLILLTMLKPEASGQIFIAADENYLSLKDLIKKIALAYNIKPLLICVPVAFMNFIATILGKKQYAARLLGNLHVDISKTKELLNWTPKYQLDSSTLK